MSKQNRHTHALDKSNPIKEINKLMSFLNINAKPKL